MQESGFPTKETGLPESQSDSEILGGERHFLEIAQELFILGKGDIRRHVSPERQAFGRPEISSHYHFFQITDSIKDELQVMYAGRGQPSVVHKHTGEWDILGFNLLSAEVDAHEVPVGLNVSAFRQDNILLDTLVIIRYGLHGKRGFYLDYQPLRIGEIGHVADTLKRIIQKADQQPDDVSLLSQRWTDQLHRHNSR